MYACMRKYVAIRKEAFVAMSFLAIAVCLVVSRREPPIERFRILGLHFCFYKSAMPY